MFVLRALVEDAGDRSGGRGVAQHAGLDRVGADIGQHALHLLADDRHGHHMDAVNAQRVLRGDCGDRGGGIGAHRGHGFDVGLDAGAGGGIGSGNDKNPGDFLLACRFAA
jgi:hypothetical protein